VSRVNGDGLEVLSGWPLFNNNKMSLGKNKRLRSRAAEGLHCQVLPTSTQTHSQEVSQSNCHESFGLSSLANHLGNLMANRILGCENVSLGMQGCDRSAPPVQALLFLWLLLLAMLLLPACL